MVGQYGGYFATTAPWNGTNFGTFNPSADWVDVPYKDMFTEFYPNFQTKKNLQEVPDIFMRGHLFCGSVLCFV